MSQNNGFQSDAGLLTKLWAGVCQITGWRCPCPRCGGRMERTIAHEDAYVRVRVARGFVSGRRLDGRMPGPAGKVKATPVHDICARCGHRIRRRNMKSIVG